MCDDRTERAAEILERLLFDAGFRAAIRHDPSGALRRAGLPDVAAELATHAKAPERLELRESRSSLAGLFMAVAAEGVSALAAHNGSLEPAPAAVVDRALERPRVRAVTRTLAIVPAHPAGHGRAHDGSRTAVSAVAAVPADYAQLPYPGDGASQARIAAWMGDAAKRAGLPPELPVMAALQESGLSSLDFGDGDSVGFFQMRLQFWNHGRYSGYAHTPELQLRWFIQRALEERGRNPQLAADVSRWNEWIANVEQCAAENRAGYGPHLAAARRLLATGADAPYGQRPPARVPAAKGARRLRTGIGPSVHGAADAADDAAGGGARLGARIVSIAGREIGVHETGWNDSARIAEYRKATPGRGVGPWCAYFVSWVARCAGVPLGFQGWGFASVDALWSWAQLSGRALAASARPRAGNLIVWDEHVGIVERVDGNGLIHTIEGNTSDRVARRVHTAAGVVGFVRLH